MRREALIAATACLGLAGCAHRDVLVFGTDTAIALDVQTAAGQGGSPSLTLGYKRKEAVWMPLLVNGADSAVPCVKATSGNCLSDGEDQAGGAKYKSTTTLRRGADVVQTSTDAYSVFASLGAKFSGAAKTGEASASGGLAQFFATGVAAINISQNEALVTALKVESPEGSKSQATAVTAAANRSAASLDAALTDVERKAIPSVVTPILAKQERRVNLVLACATDKDGVYRWDKLVEKMSYPAEDKAVYAAIPAEKLRENLRANPALGKAAITVGAAAPFNCAGE